MPKSKKEKRYIGYMEREEFDNFTSTQDNFPSFWCSRKPIRKIMGIDLMEDKIKVKITIEPLSQKGRKKCKQSIL